MSSSNTSIPPEIWDALAGKSPEERDHIVRVWNLLGYLEEEALAVPDTETALAEIDRTIETGSAPQFHVRADRRAIRRGVRRRPWLATVAALSVFFIGSIIVLWKLPVRIEARPGEQITVALPDGSSVELNSGSRIEYARRFETWPYRALPDRQIYLEGEAYFDVEPGERPFIVTSFNARVRALGTAFNVRARAASATPETIVALSHGRIQVTSQYESTLNVELSNPGETVRVASTGEHIRLDRESDTAIEHVLAWRNQGFVVVNAPLDEALQEIERRYAITVELDNPQTQADSLNLLFLSRPAPEEIVQAICLAISKNYRQTSTGFVIF